MLCVYPAQILVCLCVANVSLVPLDDDSFQLIKRHDFTSPKLFSASLTSSRPMEASSGLRVGELIAFLMVSTR
jgi:hypothetical protein